MSEAKLQRLEHWCRQYLTQLRVLRAKIVPPPLPSQFADNELREWRTQFLDWMIEASCNLMGNAIGVSKSGRLFLNYDLGSYGPNEKAPCKLQVSRSTWDLFWSQNDQLVARDPFFQITRTDQEFLTLIAIGLNIAGGLIPATVIWRTFSLSPLILECSPIYLLGVSRDCQLYQMWVDSTPEIIANLRPAWRAMIRQTCLAFGQTEQAQWLRLTCFTSEQVQVLQELFQEQ